MAWLQARRANPVFHSRDINGSRGLNAPLPPDQSPPGWPENVPLPTMEKAKEVVREGEECLTQELEAKGKKGRPGSLSGECLLHRPCI